MEGKRRCPNIVLGARRPNGPASLVKLASRIPSSFKRCARRRGFVRFCLAARMPRDVRARLLWSR